jgi:misacylated tRNA(Ala) deacylase
MSNQPGKTFSRLFCQDHQDVLQLEAAIIDARPGAVAVAQSPFFPGGGGQMTDRGTLDWTGGSAVVTGIEIDGDHMWHLLDTDAELSGAVQLTVDPVFRQYMSELHTVAHIANAVAYQAFDGALLTGAQLGDKGTLRIDLDLPEANNDQLRALEGPMNDIVQQDLAVRFIDMTRADAEAEPGLFRSKAVSPPAQDDGLVRVVEIVGLDRQACGGTHLTSTGQSRRLRVLKVDNKGRHNRRMKIGFAEENSA